jgi:thiamine biosynthesis lipoprotein
MVELGYEFTAMASPCELRLVGPDETSLAPLAEQAIEEVRRIEHKYSRYRADSVVSRINAAAGQTDAVEVDDETDALLQFADSLYQLSGGRFDITSGVLRRAWDFSAGILPTQDAVRELLPLVGWPLVRRSAGQVGLPRLGMELDFGGFGKEYAADRAAGLLMRPGLGGFVDLGGDIRVIGPRTDGAPWAFAIRHARRPDVCVAQVNLVEGALATSGDYERGFDHEGRRYSHLLDPRTGWPVQRWQSVSVVAPSCAAAGALCTTALLLESEAPALLAREGVWHLLQEAAAAPAAPAPSSILPTPREGGIASKAKRCR